MNKEKNLSFLTKTQARSDLHRDSFGPTVLQFPIQLNIINNLPIFFIRSYLDLLKRVLINCDNFEWLSESWSNQMKPNDWLEEEVETLK